MSEQENKEENSLSAALAALSIPSTVRAEMVLKTSLSNSKPKSIHSRYS